MPNQYSHKFRLIPADTRAEWCFIVLTCLLWGSSLFSYVYVVMDIILHTGMFFRTTGKYIIYIILAIAAWDYFKINNKPNDVFFVIIALLLYFLSPSADLVDTKTYSEYTSQFLYSLPFYFIGISLNFTKIKPPLWIISVLAVIVGSYYSLIYIQQAGYSGEAEFNDDNMSKSYTMLLPVLYVLWYALKDFSLTKIQFWISLATSLLGLFAISVMGTRGPFVCSMMFLLLYPLFYKIKIHKIIYGSIFAIVLYFFWINMDVVLLFMQGLSEQVGFSTRVFDTFLSEDALMDQSSGRDKFYPVLIRAMDDSPIWGYGIYGSFKFIHNYCHNIFAEIFVSFGYVIGGILIFVMSRIIYKGYKNNLTEDESNFLFVLIFEGVVSLLFSNAFFLVPTFFLFLGYSVQMAYRKI